MRGCEKRVEAGQDRSSRKLSFVESLKKKKKKKKGEEKKERNLSLFLRKNSKLPPSVSFFRKFSSSPSVSSREYQHILILKKEGDSGPVDLVFTSLDFIKFLRLGG